MSWIQGIQRAIDYAENVEFEVYSSADTSDPNYQCEIWIAVKEKS